MKAFGQGRSGCVVQFALNVLLPAFDAIAQVFSAGLFEREHGSILHGGVWIGERLAERGNGGGTFGFAEGFGSGQADVGVGVGSQRFGEESDSVGVGSFPPGFAGDGADMGLGIAEGGFQDSIGRRAGISAECANDFEPDQRIGFGRNRGGELLGDTFSLFGRSDSSGFREFLEFFDPLAWRHHTGHLIGAWPLERHPTGQFEIGATARRERGHAAEQHQDSSAASTNHRWNSAMPWAGD
jgi:hypothetical protein